MSSQSARKEESDKRPISFSLELVIVWSRPEPLTLLCGEPVPKRDSDPFGALHAADSGGQFRA